MDWVSENWVSSRLLHWWHYDGLSGQHPSACPHQHDIDDEEQASSLQTGKDKHALC